MDLHQRDRAAEPGQSVETHASIAALSCLVDHPMTKGAADAVAPEFRAHKQPLQLANDLT
jgi:hypothetical protein